MCSLLPLPPSPSSSSPHPLFLLSPLLLPQLNVFYNINNTELERRKRDVGDDEAFHLNVQFFDGQTLFGARTPPRLSVCFR